MGTSQDAPDLPLQASEDDDEPPSPGDDDEPAANDELAVRQGAAWHLAGAARPPTERPPATPWRDILLLWAAAAEARALPGSGPCCHVCVGVTALIVVSALGAAGTWLATEDSSAAVRGLSAPLVSRPSAEAVTKTTSCMVLEEGGDCYKEVLDVLHDLRDNFRSGLTKWSSFEEVQSWLHRNEGESKCLDACECEVAPINSQCYSSLVFARESGIREHPEWYPNLTEESPADDFQEHLWKFVNESECLRPCRAFPKGDPSMFCWSVARQWGYEAEVMRAQLAAGAGIFSCDGFAVASEEEWSVGRGPGGRLGEVNTLSFVGAPVGVSKDGTAANAEVFMRAWDAILQRTWVLDFDFGVKVDPDAVVVADRLRDHLRGRTGSSVFVRNCKGPPDSPDFPMMFGSLEAISREGLRVYKDAGYRCKSELPWQSWGEDFFLGKCLLQLGVTPLDDFSIVSDGVCTQVDCNDGQSAAFHPFKSSNEWRSCWNAATNSTSGPPPPLPRLPEVPRSPSARPLFCLWPFC